MVVQFKNDYCEGAHPRILQALMDTNLEQTDVYGQDIYSLEAADLIRARTGQPDAAVHFLAGGTQVNLVMLAHMLRPHQAVIAPHTGHISSNETGAIEATGHKVITVAHREGKIAPDLIEEALKAYTNTPHVVQPKVVYISHPTEIGTLYSVAELSELFDYCRRQGYYLYIDGARMASALAALPEVSLGFIAVHCDAFTIGGTKCGALLGEALAIPNAALAEDFPFIMKQRGAMTARGRVLGIQFRELFRDDLYLEVGARANAMAAILRDGLEAAGCSFWVRSETNQQFPVLPNSILGKLGERYMFFNWHPMDETHTAIRLVTSWATREENARAFVEYCASLL